MSRSNDDLVVFPTPKQAYSRASQIQMQKSQQQINMKKKPPHGIYSEPPGSGIASPTRGGGMAAAQQQQVHRSHTPQQHTPHRGATSGMQRPPPQPQPSGGSGSSGRVPSSQPQQRIPPPQQQMYIQQQNGHMLRQPPPQLHPQMQQQAPSQQQQPMMMQQTQPMGHPNGSSMGPTMVPQQQMMMSQQPPQMMPMQPQLTEAEITEQRLRDLFNKVDRNHVGYLTENELSMALFNTDQTKFQISTVKLMIKLFDKEGTGRITFREFYHLWSYINHWRSVFSNYDKDSNNSISFSEYQETLKNFGYRLPTDTVLFVFQKFSHGGGGIYLKFDSYVESLIWLLRCTNSFKKFDTQETGVAVFPFDKYIQEILGFQ